MALDYSPEDFNAAVQMVAGEGADQPAAAQADIASTAINRHNLTGQPIAKIVSDPAIYNGWGTDNAKAAVPGSPLYKTIAANIAPAFKNGPTTQATHFYNPDLVAKPGWDNGAGTRVGSHVFLDRSDLLKGNAPAAPSVDQIEADATGQGGRPIPTPGPDPTGQHYAGGDPYNNASYDNGPSVEQIEADAGVHTPGGAGDAPQTPQQRAAAADASTLEQTLSAFGHRLFNSDARMSTSGQGADLVTPAFQGVLQGWGDELKGKLFGLATGARNLAYDALGRPIPYSASDAAAAETEGARASLAKARAEHPIASAISQGVSTVAPWAVGGELLGAGAGAPEAANAAGRLVQLGGKVVAGGVKGAALGATGGAINAAGDADGSAAARLAAAGEGAGVGAVTGGALGAAAPLALPPVATALGYARREAGALGGSAVQGVRNTVNALTGRPIETTAADYFAARSPTATAFRNTTMAPEVAETVEPTAQETAAAQTKLKSMLAASGKTTADLAAVPSDLPYTTAEAAGSQTINHAASLARRAGATPDAAVEQIGNRAAGFQSAILDEFSRSGGIHPAEAAGNVEGLVSRLRTEADPLFDAVRAHQGPVWNADLAQIAQRPVVKRAIDAAATDLQNAGKDPKALGFRYDPDTGWSLNGGGMDANGGLTASGTNANAADLQPQPTAETWEAVRQRIGDQVERNPLTGKIVPDSQSRGNYNINVAKRDLTNILAGDKAGNGELIPGYRAALNKAGDYQSIQSAYDRGGASLLTDKVTAKDFDATFKGLSDGEKKAWAAGVANRLYEQAQTRAGLTQSLLKSPSFQAKLQTVLGDDAPRFIDRLTQRIRLQNTGQRILPGAGSQTTPLGIATAESAPVTDALGNVVKEIAHAKASPLTFIAKKGLSHALGDTAANVSETPGYRNAYGRLLLQHPNATAEELDNAPAITVRQLPPARPRVSALGAYVGGQVGRRRAAQ